MSATIEYVKGKVKKAPNLLDHAVHKLGPTQCLILAEWPDEQSVWPHGETGYQLKPMEKTRPYADTFFTHWEIKRKLTLLEAIEKVTEEMAKRPARY